MLSDTDGNVSAAYTAIDRADVTVPGIVVIRRDGAIVFRQVATGKADRLMASELFATIDRTLGVTGTAARSDRVFDHLQLRVDVGGGANRVDDDPRATAHASLATFYPLHRLFLVGAQTRYDFRDGMLDLDGALGLRIPLLADTGAVHLTALGGWTALEATGPNASARIGAWLALNPTWALQLDAGFGARRLSEDPLPEAFVTFGLTRLFRVR